MKLLSTVISVMLTYLLLKVHTRTTDGIIVYNTRVFMYLVGLSVY